MGSSLVLAIPDERKTEETVHKYYRYIREKREALGYEDPEYDVPGIGQYFRALEEAQEGNELYLSERLYSGVRDVADNREFRELFSLDTNDYKPPTVLETAGEIRKLIELLRDAKANLQEEMPERDWEATLELQAIALCEFAIREGYGVELSQ